MTTLRQISARFKVDARGATKEIKAFDKEIDKAKADLIAAEKAARKLADTSEKSGKKETAARKKANLALKDARKALRDLEKARKSEAAAARKAAAEQSKAAKEREKSFKDTKGSAKDAAVSIANTAKAIVAGLAAATAGVVAFTKSWADSATAIDITARQFDIGRDELQRLSGAARLAGVDTDELTDAIKEMRVKIAEAREDGITPTSEALTELGLSVDSFNGLSITEQMRLISDRMQTLGHDADRTKILMEIFGEEAGVRLAPLLDGGAAKLDGLIAKFVDFGGIVGDESIEAARDFKAEWNETVILFEVARRELAEGLAPAVRELLEEFREWIGTNKKLRRQRLERLLKQIVRVTRQLVPFFIKLAEAGLTVTEALGGVEGTLKLLIGTIATFKLATVGAFGPWAAAAVAFITLLDAIRTKQNQISKAEADRLNKAVAADPGQQVSEAELQTSLAGRRVIALRAEKQSVAARIAELGGAEGIQSAAQVERALGIVSSRDIGAAVQKRKANAQRRELRQLTRRAEVINAEIEKNAARALEERLLTQGPAAPTGDQLLAVDQDRLARFQFLSTRRRQQQGKLSKADEAERESIRLELGLGADPEKVKDPKTGRAKKKKTKKERAATISELLGLPGGAGFKTIAETQPKGLGTVLNTFNITNQIGVPAFNVNIQAAPGSTMKGQANAVVAAMGDGASIIVRQAQRASIGQVLG